MQERAGIFNARTFGTAQFYVSRRIRLHLLPASIEVRRNLTEAIETHRFTLDFFPLVFSLIFALTLKEERLIIAQLARDGVGDRQIRRGEAADKAAGLGGFVEIEI